MFWRRKGELRITTSGEESESSLGASEGLRDKLCLCLFRRAVKGHSTVAEGVE